MTSGMLMDPSLCSICQSHLPCINLSILKVTIQTCTCVINAWTSEILYCTPTWYLRKLLSCFVQTVWLCVLLGIVCSQTSSVSMYDQYSCHVFKFSVLSGNSSQEVSSLTAIFCIMSSWIEVLCTLHPTISPLPPPRCTITGRSSGGVPSFSWWQGWPGEGLWKVFEQ